MSINGLDNERAAERIAAAELDLLVDLNGYSALGRLPVVAYRPARGVVCVVQPLRHVGDEARTTVSSGILLSSTPDEEIHYTEKIARVSGSYLTFDVAYDVPPVEEAPARRNGHITFGCFASQYKLTPQVVKAWAAILDGAPDAELLVKRRAMEAECNRVGLLERFTEHGVDPARIITIEPGAPHYDYLAAYSRVDVALDPFPYNGGTTTSEALWQGVPVLCFDGDRWAARQGASLLRAAGLDDFVARDEADYIARGIELGQGFADDRMAMRDRLLSSRLMDTAAFAREIETIYRRVASTASAPSIRDVIVDDPRRLHRRVDRRRADEAEARLLRRFDSSSPSAASRYSHISRPAEALFPAAPASRARSRSPPRSCRDAGRCPRLRAAARRRARRTARHAPDRSPRTPRETPRASGGS